MFDFSLAPLLAPLLVGVILSQALRVSLKTFTGIYLFLVASAVGIAYLAFNLSFVPPLIVGAVGLLVVAIFAGVGGTRVRSSDYALALFGTGLFPWYLGTIPSVVYGVLFVGFVILIALRPKFNNPLKRRFKRS